ncbi:hypothetical protein STANM309S_00644 [Streptomyces tanashiensis]
MHLHHLTVQAFGPFARTESVDFDTLAGNGLFLLRGDTGAGKTSVLDAVCFALYGTVPGIRPTHRLRSDHAPTATRTTVTLDFSAAGRRLKITRTPSRSAPAPAPRTASSPTKPPSSSTSTPKPPAETTSGTPSARTIRTRPERSSSPGPEQGTVLPGRPPAPGGLRQVPPLRRQGPSRPLRAPLRHRPLPGTADPRRPGRRIDQETRTLRPQDGATPVRPAPTPQQSCLGPAAPCPLPEASAAAQTDAERSDMEHHKAKSDHETAADLAERQARHRDALAPPRGTRRGSRRPFPAARRTRPRPKRPGRVASPARGAGPGRCRTGTSPRRRPPGPVPPRPGAPAGRPAPPGRAPGAPDRRARPP